MKSIFIIILMILPIISCASSTKVFDTKKSNYISSQELINTLPAQGIFILGEFHNDTAIQNAQAQLIQKKVLLENAQNDFTVNWEFINHTEEAKTQKLYKELLESNITVQQFISLTAGKQNTVYAPIIEVSKNLQGEFRGVNLPRSLKQKVIKEGIQSIDPKYIPSFHYDGGAEYKERFLEVMGNHVPTNKLDSYFTAQCLTDSVMAEQVHINATKSLSFLIAGSFHTDFYDATVARLKNLTNENIVTFKFVNEDSIDAAEVKQYLQGHKSYGAYADYIVIVTK